VFQGFESRREGCAWVRDLQMLVFPIEAECRGPLARESGGPMSRGGEFESALDSGLSRLLLDAAEPELVRVSGRSSAPWVQAECALGQA
jgi:hypothetical protein